MDNLTHKQLVDVLHPRRKKGSAETGMEDNMPTRRNEREVTVDEEPQTGPTMRGKQVVLSNATLIPLSVLVAIVIGIVTLDRRLSAMENNQTDGKRIMGDLNTSIHHTWNVTDMKLWTNQLRSQNPDIKVPDPTKYDD